MKEIISLKGNIIKYDEESKYKTVGEIIENRFKEDDFILDTSLDLLHDPYGMQDMDKAVERIKIAKDKNEKVIIFGDYDVDGVTSTSLLVHFFTKIGLQVSYRLPHREKDGYGLKTYFVDELVEVGVDLIVTVDCGTRDIDVIRYAKEKNIDVIITDHHSVPDIIPDEAIAIINPKRNDCNYCNKNLSGAGVAFKLIQALSVEFLTENEAKVYLQESIDIAAIGTVADCMELTGENRVIVKEGLKQVKNSRSLGIRRLVEEKIHEDIDADIFSFLIGPKLNAAGRLDTPYKAVNLILNNGDTVDKNVSEIEKLNEKRKYLTTKFYADALANIKHDNNIIFYISPAIEHGIIGIVAGRLCEAFHKPVICLKDEGDKLVASCRSPEYYSIIDLLEKFKDYFLAFGGHKQAAGFSISKDKFGEFKTKIINEINKEDFSNYKKEIKIDKIIKLEEIGFNLIQKINEYKPYGLGNPKPLFMVEDLEYENMEFLSNGRDHVKFTNKFGFKIMAFGMGEYYKKIIESKKNVNIIFEISEDSWNGNKSIMLKVIDIALI